MIGLPLRGKVDCKQSIIFLCKVTAREFQAREIRTRRILRDKAECKQSRDTVSTNLAQ